jgi:polysaccharide export outer membrane protein
MRKGMIPGLLIMLALTMGPRTGAQSGEEKAKETESAPAAARAKSGEKDAATGEEGSYVIGAQDILDISVWKEPDVSRRVPVRPDGKISLPLLNDIQAAGLTPLELQQQITDGLKKFLTAPQVTVTVIEINSKRVYIVGEVGRTGALAMLPNMTVLQALSAAGGFRQFANPKKIYVMRNEHGKQVTYPFNYNDVVRGIRPEQNIILKPGDTIVVP